jgi:hypothetical protein
VAFYRKLDRNRAVRWHDVSADVETLQLHGVTQSDALARLHARLSDGRLVTGVQAFIAVWERIPGFKMLYQRSLIGTHCDGLSRFPTRSAVRRDAGASQAARDAARKPR